MSVNPWEKYRAGKMTIRVKKLGELSIEVLTSNRKKQLRQKIHESVEEADYITDVSLDKGGNLSCRLLSVSGMKFNDLIQQVVNLIASVIERYEKKPRHKTISTQSNGSRQVRRPAMQHPTPNYRVAAAKA